MMNQVLSIDDIDKQILRLIQKKPNLTHTEIASKVNRSQPTVGMRIRRLEESGVLQFQAGINIKTTDMCFARVDIQSNKPEVILDLVNHCPYMLNAFRLSGTINISVLLASFNYKTLDRIVNYHFRNNPDVIKVTLDVITDVAQNFILPIDLNFECCYCSSKVNQICFEG